MHYLTDAEKLAILRANPHVVAVYQNPNPPNKPIQVLIIPNTETRPLTLPAATPRHMINLRPTMPIQDLRLRQPHATDTCYNEPVPCGCQIQPRGLGWVGTLGAAICINPSTSQQRWGILSNWHVLCCPTCETGHDICQPLDNRPAIATLYDWLEVDPIEPNFFDAAIADSFIDGYHTTNPIQRNIGKIGEHLATACLGCAVPQIRPNHRSHRGQSTSHRRSRPSWLRRL